MEVRSQHVKDDMEQVRPAFVHPTSPPNLFVSERGRPMHPCTIRDKVGCMRAGWGFSAECIPICSGPRLRPAWTWPR